MCVSACFTAVYVVTRYIQVRIPHRNLNRTQNEVGAEYAVYDEKLVVAVARQGAENDTLQVRRA